MNHVFVSKSTFKVTLLYDEDGDNKFLGKSGSQIPDSRVPWSISTSLILESCVYGLCHFWATLFSLALSLYILCLNLKETCLCLCFESADCIQFIDFVVPLGLFFICNLKIVPTIQRD